MVNNVDIVADLSWGDTGKGKITSHLARNNNYDFVCRWAGGDNAGHTVFIDDEKYKTHLVPSGVFHGVKSIIGPGCVISKDSFYSEILYLEEKGFDTSLVKVSPRAHVVLDRHIGHDIKVLTKKLGTTSKGIAPCYADKMARVGIQAKDIMPKEFILEDEALYGNILCEGAQGFYLDVDWGDYPYVTSSVTLPYGACSLGFSPKKIRNIWGTAKIYDTRSGVDPLFPNSLFEDSELSELGRIGEERGVTTGRRRHVNWLRIDYLINAINKSGATHIVINKCDIIDKLGVYKIINDNVVIEFPYLDDMVHYIRSKVITNTMAEEIHFSFSKEVL